MYETGTSRIIWEGKPERVKAPYMEVKVSQQYPEYGETRGILSEVSETTPKG